MEEPYLKFDQQENGLYTMVIDGITIGTDLTMDEVMSAISRRENDTNRAAPESV